MKFLRSFFSRAIVTIALSYGFNGAFATESPEAERASQLITQDEVKDVKNKEQYRQEKLRLLREQNDFLNELVQTQGKMIEKPQVIVCSQGLSVSTKVKASLFVTGIYSGLLIYLYYMSPDNSGTATAVFNEVMIFCKNTSNDVLLNESYAPESPAHIYQENNNSTSQNLTNDTAPVSYDNYFLRAMADTIRGTIETLSKNTSLVEKFANMTDKTRSLLSPNGTGYNYSSFAEMMEKFRSNMPGMPTVDNVINFSNMKETFEMNYNSLVEKFRVMKRPVFLCEYANKITYAVIYLLTTIVFLKENIVFSMYFSLGTVAYFYTISKILHS